MALAAGLYVVSQVNYPLFHTLVELVGVSVGISIFFLTYHARRQMENNTLLMLGVAFLFVSLLALLHTLAYKGMGVFPGYDANLPTQLWIGLRLMTAATYLLAPLTLNRPLRLEWLLAVYAPSTALVIWLAFSGLGPDCFIEGQGLTPFKIAMEYLALLLLAGSAWLFWRRREHFDPRILHLLLLSISASALAGVAFSLYSDVYGLANFIGHMVVLLSVILLRQAVFVIGVANPYTLLSQRLRRSEEKYRGMVERSTDGLFQTDLTGVVLTANPAFAGLFGYADQRQVLGLPLARHLPGGEAQFRELLAPALSGGLVRAAEVCLVRLDGRPQWVSFSARVELGETPARLEGSLHDIGLRMEMERLRQDMERILQHELRSPLAGIVGLGELLRMDGDLPGEAAQMVGLIEDAGHRMLRMIDENVILRRLEEGTYELHAEPVNLPSIIDIVRPGVDALSKRREISLRLEIDGAPFEPGAHLIARLDAILLEHLLSNLLRNAVEAAPSGSTVTLRLFGGDPLRMEVHNLGAVPGDVRERFFERYATSGKAKGTGLGTYVARLAVLAHGGAISFTTDEAQGTTLFVSLPNPG